MNATTTPFRGGRVFSDDDAQQQQEQPASRRHRCFAEGCPMPGTITLDGRAAPSCAWHYGVLPSDVPKVTRVLQDWQCVTDEINEARRALTGPMAADPKALRHRFDAAWGRLRPLAGTWAEQLQPGEARTSKGEPLGHREAYDQWSRRLERFIGARVVEVLNIRQREIA